MTVTPPGAPADREPLRVLRVLTRTNLGGPARQAIALWHAHRALGVETLLVAGPVGPEEVDLSPLAHGVPAADPDAGVGGFLRLPSLRRGIGPLRDLRARRELRRIVQVFAPHVVHTHTSKAGWLGRSAARRERVPVLAHTFHGHVLHDYFAAPVSAALAQLERRLARGCQLLFAVSGSCADELAQCGVAPRERFVVVPPAVPRANVAPRAEARQELGVPAAQWRVAAIGRLVPIKRLQDFVATVALDDELHGDVFGHGPERERLEELAARRCGDRLLLRGPRADIARWLPAYDAVVLPSVREGCPLVAIEAFQAGVPVVGYDVPGVRDALRDVGSGVLVPPGDGQAGLLRALQRLQHDDAAERARTVARAREGVQVCSPEAVAARLRDAYLVARNAAQAR